MGLRSEMEMLFQVVPNQMSKIDAGAGLSQVRFGRQPVLDAEDKCQSSRQTGDLTMVMR